MTFTKWVAENHVTIFSLAALCISGGALIVSLKAYRINRSVAERAGRLRQFSITKVNPGTRRYSRGFKASNGPNEVTISDILLSVTYMITAEESYLKSLKFERYVRPTSFTLLGLEGPDLPIRLAPYDDVVWQLPPWRALDLPHKVVIDGTSYAQCIHLKLIATVSGDEAVSDELGMGRHAHMPITSVDRYSDQSLEELLEDTRRSSGNGHLTIGLHEWLKKLIEEAAIALSQSSTSRAAGS